VIFPRPWRRRRSALDHRSVESLLNEGFVALDLETTGLDPRRDDIVEIAAVPFIDARPQHAYVTRVNPGRPIPSDASRIHGITDDMVVGAPRIAEALAELDDICRGRLLVGHGIGFDLSVLSRVRRSHRLQPIRHVAIDIMRLVSALHPEWQRFDFDDIAARVGIGVLGRHTAEGDAVAAGEILLALIPEITARRLRTIGDLIWIQDTAERTS
jgi:DNA polymerase III epsilon subunit family exonuclease